MEGKGEEKCGESEPIFTNYEGDVQIKALTRGRSSSSRHEGKLLVPGHKPKRKKESDFHKAAVSDSSGKSGPNPVGFSKWGQTLPAGSTPGYSTLTALGGSATKRTQTRDEGAHSQFVKRGKPNPTDAQAAQPNRLALHKAKVESRMVKKHPRKRGILKLSWTEQREVFRDMSRRRRDQYAANKSMIEALSEPTKVFEPKHDTSWGAYSAAGKHDVCTIMGIDPLKSKNDEAAYAPDSSTLVPWVETLVSSAVDAAAVEVEAGTEVHLSRKCRTSLELLVKQISQVKAFRTAARQPYVRSVDSKGSVKILFCDTGNNASSVMALDRFEIELKHNPGEILRGHVV